MIWNFCIRRPVLTVVIFLVIGIFGIYGYNQMAVREFPDVEFPVVNVNVVLSGAEPEVIETEVLEPLEEELNTIEGLKTLQSTAREEVGTVTAEFQLWRDIDIAAQDVRDRVNRAQRQLPDDIQAPIVQKLDPDAQAIMWLTLQGNERWSTVDMTEYADNQIKPQLESMRGVGRVQVGGERKLAVRIKLDPQELASHRVTVGDVVRTIQENNVDIPAGRITGEKREFLIKTEGQFSGPEPFNDLIIAHRDGSPVRLRDVGRAVEGVENDRQLARFSGEPTVGLGIVKQSDANTVKLADEVRAEIERISENFPPGLQYKVATDDSTYVAENISDLQTTIIIATVLVVFVILFFLRSVWATLITSIAIPTSLAAGMALIYSFGFSLNVLSMLAFILVIGIVVDDAIVVLESSYRHLERGASQMAGARVGTTEIAFAAIANTLSLAAVFIPVAFTRGIIGRFFFEFGVTVAVTVFASTFTALTLTPMLCSRLLTVPERRGWFWEWTESVFTTLESIYETLLDWSLNYRTVVVIVAIVMLGLGIFFFQGLSKEFAPSVDRGEFRIVFEMPEGATLDETNQYAKKIEQVLFEVPEVTHFFLAIGLSQGGGPGKVNSGITFAKMDHRSKRERSHQQVMADVRERLAKIPEGQAYVLEPSGPGGSGAPLQVVLQNPDLDELAARKNEIVAWMRQQEEFVGVNADLKMNKPQVQVDINRDKASQMGISVADISNSLRFLMGEPDISEIERGSERYEVIPEIVGKNNSVPSVINDMYIRGEGGELISMGNLVSLDEIVGPSEIHHYNRQRSVTISASTPPDVVMGDALNKLRGHLAGALPAGFEWTSAGQAEDMQESFYYLTVSLVFAIVFVYLVLAGQFESWVHPFTILMTLPLAAVGAYGMLYALDMTFSVFTFIGTIMLVGLVTKNGILLIDYANVLMSRGHETFEAAKEAGLVRFRPVLMTAVSTILGMMPIALGFGAGGEARAPMGWTVAGGMFTATGLTLLVIPVIYTLIDDGIRFIQHHVMTVIRYLLALSLLAVGVWMFSLPLQFDWTGLYFVGSWFNGTLFTILAWGMFQRQTWSRYGALLVTGIALAKGMVMWLQLDLVVKLMPAPLDPVMTGQIMVISAILGLVLLNLPGIMSERTDPE